MSSPSDSESAQMRDSFETFLYRTSQATLVVAPVLILLPPRKIDFYTFALSGAFVVSAGHLYQQRQANTPSKGSFLMPAKAKELQAQLASDKERERQRRLLEEPGSVATDAEKRRSGGLLEEKAREIWMGGETEDWKERRLREERERLAKGEGYGDLIMDQIREVWNWGEKKAEDLKEKDEDIMKRIQREREFPRIGKD